MVGKKTNPLNISVLSLYLVFIFLFLAPSSLNSPSGLLDEIIAGLAAAVRQIGSSSLWFLTDPLLVSSAIVIAAFFAARIPRFRRLAITIGILASIRYLVWRLLFSLNFEDWVTAAMSVSIWTAEFFGFLLSLLFFYQIYNNKTRCKPASTGQNPTVDIFIPIFNEPKEILFKTIVGCKAQNYPRNLLKVFVLDDGEREEIKTLCDQLDCYYIARPTHEHAKAGNLNYAFKQTRGELVAIFDCDHVPIRDFLQKTIRFLGDSRIAFVQTAHHFYNSDSFQRNLRLESVVYSEQDLFFHVILPGRDFYNSAFFAGSSAVFRRKVLEEIDGFQTATITEDIHTSMEIHARGYESVYINEDLSAGLAPESYEAYLKQRKRWAKGGIHLFMLDNPLVKRGLSLHQKLNYFASNIYFFHGFARILYLLGPIMYLLFGYKPILANFKSLLFFYAPHFLANLWVFKKVSENYRNSFWSDIYETAMSFTLSRHVLSTLISPKEHVFDVTPKGEKFEKTKITLINVIPHLIIASLLFLGLIYGTFNLLFVGANLNAYLINAFWASYNFILLASAIAASRERPQRRDTIRLPRKIKTKLFLSDRSVFCLTRDLSETGASFFLKNSINLDTPFMNLELTSDFGEKTYLSAKVMTYERFEDQSLVGVQFQDLDQEKSASIIRQMFSSSHSWEGAHESNSHHQSLVKDIHTFVLAPLGAFIQDKILRRLSPRFYVRLPVTILLDDGELKGVTKDISSSGISVDLNTSRELSGTIDFVIRKDIHELGLRGKIMRVTPNSSGCNIGIELLEQFRGDFVWTQLQAIKKAGAGDNLVSAG